MRISDWSSDVCSSDLRLRSALEPRERLFDRPFYRVVHAEADGLPGLVVDRYGDVLVVQMNAALMDRLNVPLLEALDAVLAPRPIVLRNDSPARALGGLGGEVRNAKGVALGSAARRERVGRAV